MKNTIIVLLRSELNYLIKYDSLRTSSDRIIHLSYLEFGDLSEERQMNLLQNSIPIYEQDHEVILIEYNRDLEYDNAPLLKFKGISSIIPLTETALRLLSSKLNIDFNIMKPLDSLVYKYFSNYRSHIFRYEGGKQLCSIYKLKIPKEDFITDFKAATLFQLNNNKPKDSDTTLAHLVDFNITPSFIPEGNIEALIKSACIGMRKLGQDVNKITKSAFYNFVIQRKLEINETSLFKAIQYIDKNTIEEDELKRFKKLKNTLSENGKYTSAFLLFTYFYYLKRLMEKNHYDIEIIKEEILELKYYDIESASKVLFMLGYTFSIQTISKSIQSFSNSVLLKTRKNLDLEWAPKDIEQKNKENQFEKDNTKFEDNESVLFKNQIESSFADEKAIEIQPQLEDEPEETNSTMVSKMNNDLDLTNMAMGLFSTKKELSNEVEIVSIFNLAEFKKNIGGGEKSKKLIEALNDRNIDEKDVSKEIVISCLKEISLYANNKGKIYDFAEKALKIFE
jgi:hypothetical protein